jgi:hypothetical protein
LIAGGSGRRSTEAVMMQAQNAHASHGIHLLIAFSTYIIVS